MAVRDNDQTSHCIANIVEFHRQLKLLLYGTSGHRAKGHMAVQDKSNDIMSHCEPGWQRISKV